MSIHLNFGVLWGQLYDKASRQQREITIMIALFCLEIRQACQMSLQDKNFQVQNSNKNCKNLFAKHLGIFRVLISENLGDVGIATLLMRLEMEDGGSVFDVIYGIYTRGLHEAGLSSRCFTMILSSVFCLFILSE